MTPNWPERISHLRRNARHCRDLAQGALPPQTQSELEALAASYEAEANEIERRHGARVPHRARIAG
jgi:hypothetical protein